MDYQKAPRARRVFLSHSSADTEVVQRVAASLQEGGISSAIGALSFQTEGLIRDVLRREIGVGDCVVVFLSRSTAESRSVTEEWMAGLTGELTARNIEIIPVILSDCLVPADLATRPIIDLRHDWRAGIESLTNRIDVGSQIDFSSLDWLKFERLIVDLLGTLGFSDIRLAGARDGDRYHSDIIATSVRLDSSGNEIRQNWLVEAKLYKEHRADLHSLRKLASILIDNVSAYGLLVTNGHLTSAARDWLQHHDSSSGRIRVIDGPALRTLLAAQPAIVHRYFLARP